MGLCSKTAVSDNEKTRPISLDPLAAPIIDRTLSVPVKLARPQYRGAFHLQGEDVDELFAVGANTAQRCNDSRVDLDVHTRTVRTQSAPQ